MLEAAARSTLRRHPAESLARSAASSARSAAVASPCVNRWSARFPTSGGRAFGVLSGSAEIAASLSCDDVDGGIRRAIEDVLVDSDRAAALDQIGA